MIISDFGYPGSIFAEEYRRAVAPVDDTLFVFFFDVFLCFLCPPDTYGTRFVSESGRVWWRVLHFMPTEEHALPTFHPPDFPVARFFSGGELSLLPGKLHVGGIRCCQTCDSALHDDVFFFFSFFFSGLFAGRPECWGVLRFVSASLSPSLPFLFSVEHGKPFVPAE